MRWIVDDFSHVNERVVNFGWSEYHKAFVVSAACKSTGLVREILEFKGRSQFDEVARYKMNSWLNTIGIRS
ncbi:hypothetical protein VPHK359_0094 [Vibrio phage K359]